MNNRRFNGTRTLYGDVVEGFGQARVCVVGIGGVGSWAVEALARTAVGELTLIDMDILVESNVNRQLPATTDTFGESKAETMAKRAKAINPDIKVNVIDDFITPENIHELLPSKETLQQYRTDNKPFVILDCTDDIKAKVAIALYCRFNKVALIVSGGAGGKVDPLKIKVADLKEVYQDPLLAKLRQTLKEKGINRELKHKFRIKCVFSSEALKLATACDSGLNCGGYGSAVVVTNTVAMVMVAECLKLIAAQFKPKPLIKS